MTKVMVYFAIGTAVQGWTARWSSLQGNVYVQIAKALTLFLTDVGTQTL